MDKRLIKQIIIGFIFILIISGLIFLVYYLFRPGPSCSDNIQNQGEEGIDCGGPCQPCELVNIEEIKVLSTGAVSIEQGFYDLFAQIKNPNQNYGSGDVPYEFKLYDSQNNMVGEYIGSSFILPNQTKYVVQLKVRTMGEVNRVELSFGQVEWQKLKDYQLPQLVVKQKEYYLLENQEAYSQVRGVLANKTNFDFDKISVDILLFDSSRKLIALNTTEIKSLLSNQERDFIVNWFNPIKEEAVFLEAEAETNVFDSDNYMKKHGEVERFQQY